MMGSCLNHSIGVFFVEEFFFSCSSVGLVLVWFIFIKSAPNLCRSDHGKDSEFARLVQLQCVLQPFFKL